METGRYIGMPVRFKFATNNFFRQRSKLTTMHACVHNGQVSVKYNVLNMLHLKISHNFNFANNMVLKFVFSEKAKFIYYLTIFFDYSISYRNQLLYFVRAPVFISCLAFFKIKFKSKQTHTRGGLIYFL